MSSLGVTYSYAVCILYIIILQEKTFMRISINLNMYYYRIIVYLVDMFTF